MPMVLPVAIEIAFTAMLMVDRITVKASKPMTFLSIVHRQL